MDSGQIASIVLASIVCATIVIGIVAQAWASSRSRAGSGNVGGGSLPKRLDALEDRLYRLEQAIDTVALEVERGAEAQRFTAKLLAERLEGVSTTRAASRTGDL